MELELGLKLTRATDDFTSDFQIVKNRAGPVFLSSETDALFVLTAHLKGYERKNIKIDINEDGTLMAISGERHVKETVMVGWKVYKKDPETKEFNNVFKIPGDVILDEIKASYNDDESTLKITMPKKVKGIQGTSIDEVIEKDELTREGSSNFKIAKGKEGASYQDNDEIAHKTQLETREKKPEKEKPVDKLDRIQEISQCEQDMHENDGRALDDECRSIREEKRSNDENEGPSVVEPENCGDHTIHWKRCKMCIPIVAGSTLLLSLMVFVVQMIRGKNQNKSRY